MRTIGPRSAAPAAVHRFLAACDTAAGNVVESTEQQVTDLLSRARGVLVPDDRGIAALALVDGTTAQLRASPGVPSRAALLRRLMGDVGGQAADASWWLHVGDRDAAMAAEAAGLVRSYGDLQLRRAVGGAAPSTLPEGARSEPVRALGDQLVREVHDLVVRAWSVPEHLDAFRRRFVVDAEPALWVLVRDESGSLAAAAIGGREEVGDGLVGQVLHLDVDPDRRRRGLGRWALDELCHRFAGHGLEVAQLGVHDDNASGAPELYARWGWKVVSRQDRWDTARTTA